MNDTEFEKWVRAMHDKADYGFVTLSFATIALSFQYSPGMGNAWPMTLVLSWLFLLASGLIGGWRIVQQTAYYRINLFHARIDTFTKKRQVELSNPSFLMELNSRRVLDEATGKPLSEKELRDQLSIEDTNKREAKANMDKISSRLPVAYKVQAFLFSFGIVLNFVFVSINYLKKS